MNYGDFDHFLGRSWIDREDRPKTMKALLLARERIPPDFWDSLPQDTIIFAPSPGMDVDRLLRHQPAMEVDSELLIIYLAPRLEDQPQEYVDSTVARELARAMLSEEGRSGREEDSSRLDREVDDFVERFGYRQKEKARSAGAEE